MSVTVLLVDDDAAVREALAQTLELADLHCIAAGSFVVAADHIKPEFDGVIVSDIRMPGRDGFHLLSHAQGVDPDIPVILLTGEGDIPMAVKAMGEGAFDFLEKPCAAKELLAVVERALKTRSLVLENRQLRELVESGDPAARMIFGASGLAQGLRAHVRRVAQAQGDVLVSGAQGSGISKIAEVIHLSSLRSKRPFLKRAASDLDALALGAVYTEGEGGSLFIDEIALLPAQSQMALAETLDGAPTTRLIAGTTRDLAAEMEAGRFNADLYYRLAVMPVRIPALSERPEDIPVLFRHYVAQAAEQSGQPAPPVGAQIDAALMAREWPGNARALMTEAMRFVMGMTELDRPELREVDETLGLTAHMAQVEQSLIEGALRRAQGQATEAARALKLPRKTFYDKCTRYGIKPEEFRS
ncbi:sigma-54-dependent transcriptional regulator [Sulfitobacter guttiformis]|uniref:Two-component system C4-dicarboxylate transport response regulator DctD n=1 Tax=Sulfitobacter guttiformis TaxID=74349 RepID=A0A420DIJ6_9RHOB|nr:sigma-54 dependent transcriptional regulator [Sulfitobacter guttiformis]KIN72177.1 C4-dicarboxylate transport transcriptional regulatory protein [Sulfitobacter guttiformis KCTC 32187]RKE94050.1 two-component system C4-dicarboxylate transport response regulator DctD [Sulfitobacter guttiformis]